MSTEISRIRFAILGVAILLAVLAAGCTSQYGPSTTPAQTTPATTVPQPVTTVATPVPTATVTRPTAVVTTPVATTTAAPTTVVPPAPVAITIQGFTFNPASITVPAGTMVTWTNDDTAPHTIVSDATAFRSNAIAMGGSYSFTFTAPGTYPYHCGIHPFMHGTVTVT
ncbi:MAG: cupredoxin family copper-binding protein [Methanomicrobiales archaeon]|nr:cupredoxin family copper-binding protein [Methanomicrobiales archaeon]